MEHFWRAGRFGLSVVLKLCVTLFVVSVITFVATVAVPGDPARGALGRDATPEQLEAFRELHGLDRSLVVQYADWIGSWLTGDWGESYVSGIPVSELIEPRLGRTLILTLSAFVVAAVVGVGLGMWSARRTGRLDLGLTVGTITLGAIPEFVIGILLIAVFAVWLGWFPIDSVQTALPDVPFWELVRAYTLPVLAVSALIIPYVLRMTRANAREVLTQPYVRAAVMRGIGGRRLTYHHVFPNAAPPIVNVLALNVAATIGGVVATEAVFGLPGIGLLLVDAVGARDLPVVQALALIIGAFFVIVNILADVLVRLLTPQLREAVV